MRFLADMGVSQLVVRELRCQGHEAVHLRELNLPRLPDSEILTRARGLNEIILTFDLDFGDLMLAGAYTLPTVIIFRLRDARPAVVARRLLEVLDTSADELREGIIMIVEDARCRKRRLPIDTGGSD